MLKFWKKPGSKLSSKSGPPSPLRSPCSDGLSHINGEEGVSNQSGDSVISLAHFEENELDQTEDLEWLHHSGSRLSMSLSEVIADKGALGYFIQYLEARSSGALIRFYLDVECFRSAAHEDARALGSHEHKSNFSNDSKANSGSNCDSVLTSIVCKTQNDIPVEAKDNDVKCETEAIEGASVHGDAVRIFEKYLGLNAPFQIPIDEDIRNSVALAVCDEGHLDPECFSPAQTLCYSIMEEEYFNEFLRSDFYCKHQIDVLTSGDVSLMDILHNQTSLFYFMEFMEQENRRAFLEFWLVAHNFASHLNEDCPEVDVQQAQSDAIVLYDKYFSLQATCPLGFSDKIRVEIENNISNENGPPPTCFSRPLKIVLRFLHKNYLKAFLQSQLYFKYLSELVNTIQATKNCGSDCGSDVGERPSQSTNTLLASGDLSFPRKTLRNMEQQNLSIDSRQLYDPDSLWKRTHPSGLSFGRINELGRFETEVEPEPDKKSESRITRAMKKLVHMDEDKAKEEMAWQIAEMIVKDVTNLTLQEDNG